MYNQIRNSFEYIMLLHWLAVPLFLMHINELIFAWEDSGKSFITESSGECNYFQGTTEWNEYNISHCILHSRHLDLRFWES